MNALEIRSLQAAYGAQTVLHDIDLQIPLGSWFCLLGPNGVGKSTLVHCLSGRVEPQRGSIRICGHALDTEPLAAKGRLGLACTPEQLPGLLSGWQCLEVYASAKGMNSFDQSTLTLLEALHVEKYLDKCVDTYSLGTRQKLCVLLGLLGEPGLIVLDEAFNGLDPRSARVLKKHLCQRLVDQRAAILLATHSLDIVQRYGTGAALLLEGRIAHAWTAAELRELRGKAFERALSKASDVMSR